ncbi:hypothetical protein WJX84_004880 [Apatococcus fuscideae]|uniref:BFN domain-containing protein n=1 Tax=Apatococcus fuscideae TaxID=2026836 RepID=A0AAW1T1T7_9CHLO
MVRAGNWEEYPFNLDDYHRVGLHVVASPAHVQGTPSGQLILMRQLLNGFPPEDDQNGLVLGVSGDTLLAVTQQAQGQSNSRPLSLDLLWKMLERGMETQRTQWQLLRVAIVELRDFTFIGRIFLGDRETGIVAWDCDCRPSDAVWLAQKTHAPMYVHKQVWRENSTPLTHVSRDETRTPLQEAQAALQMTRAKLEKHFSSTSPDANTYIRWDDPEPVKRLKREMQVALNEEDYIAAVRIRDHPFMKLHREIQMLRRAGQQDRLPDSGLVHRINQPSRSFISDWTLFYSSALGSLASSKINSRPCAPECPNVWIVQQNVQQCPYWVLAAVAPFC